MTLKEFKQHLKNESTLNIYDANGLPLQPHYHLTEIGLSTKKFVDCGGTYREEEKVSLQLWYGPDTDHRLSVEKLIRIIEIGEEKLGINEQELELEYQGATIGKFGLDKSTLGFQLVNTQTACLAEDACGIPQQKQKIQLADFGGNSANTCTPGSGCC